MAIKTYKTFSDSTEANIALTKLQANNVPCFLTNEQMNDLLWHMKIGLGGVRLMLNDYDFEKANQILSPEPTPITDEQSGELTCPQCGSNNVKFGPEVNPKLSIIGFFRLLFYLILLVPAPIPIKSYHCFNCELDFRTNTDETKANII